VASMDLVLHRWWFVASLYLIGTIMMGLLLAKPWESATFHFLYHMNIIMETRFNSWMGKMEPNNTLERGYRVCVSLLYILAFWHKRWHHLWRHKERY
jgi:hypothetical protein